MLQRKYKKNPKNKSSKGERLTYGYLPELSFWQAVQCSSLMEVALSRFRCWGYPSAARGVSRRVCCCLWSPVVGGGVSVTSHRAVLLEVTVSSEKMCCQRQVFKCLCFFFFFSQSRVPTTLIPLFLVLSGFFCCFFLIRQRGSSGGPFLGGAAPLPCVVLGPSPPEHNSLSAA